MTGLEFVGTATLVVLFVFIIWILLALVRDGATCARFAIRVARTATRATSRPEFCFQVIRFWFFTWIGVNSRPDSMRNTVTGAVAYWPGKEKIDQEQHIG